MIDLTECRALAEAARADTSDGLVAREALSGVVDQLADLLDRATEFEFHPDLDDLAPIGGDWHVRVERFGGAWMIRWAYTGRAWSRRHGGWLNSEAVDRLLLPVPLLADDLLFSLSEAMEMLPGILDGQRRRAQEAVNG